MLYDKLTLKGFGNFPGETSYCFPGCLTYITGANGSGKSTIIDAVQWCFFGPSGSSRTLKDRTSIINTSAQSAVVKLDMVHDFFGDVSIVRKLTRDGKHAVQVTVDGEKITGVTQGQETIDELLGFLTPDVFRSVFILESSPVRPPSTFISATPQKRRGILSSIVDPAGDYAEANKTFRKHLRESKKLISKLEGAADSLEDTLNGFQIDNTDLVDTIRDLEDETARLKSRLQAFGGVSQHDNLDVLKNDLKKDQEKLDKLRLLSEANEDGIGENKGTIESFQGDLVEIRKDITSTERKLQLAEAERDVADVMIAETDRQLENITQALSHCHDEKVKIDFLASVEHSDHCPVCGSEVDDADLTALFDPQGNEQLTAELEKQRKTLTDRREKLQGRHSTQELSELLARYQQEEEDTHTEITRLEEANRKLFEDQNDTTAEIQETLWEFEALQKTISDLEKNLDNDQSLREANSIRRKIRQLDEQIVDLKGTQSFNEREKERAKESETRFNATLKELDQETKRRNQLENLVAQSSPSGDISDAISSLMDTISTTATDLYNQQFAPTDPLDISLLDTDSKGEPSCVITCNGRDLGTYSHGEQLRMFSAIQMALISAVYDTTGWWIPPMWDEPSLAVDFEAAQDVLAIPELITPENHQFFIATREDTPHDDGIATITL